MPGNTNPLFMGTRRTAAVSITSADGTTPQTLFTAGPEGAAVTMILATSTDTVDIEIDVFLETGGVSYGIGGFTVLDGSGTNGGTDPAVAGWNSVDFPWLKDDLIMDIGPNDKINVAAHSAVSGGAKIDIVALGGDY